MSFLCSTCSAHFDDNFQRREHMREEWHVYNVKRKVASLPPISSVTYHTVFAPSAKPEIPGDTEVLAIDTDDNGPVTRPYDSDGNKLGPEQCIFCLTLSEDPVQNVTHMAASHGLFLPNLEKLETDLETLISYLGLVATHYCECLFCGATKRSARAARMHMLAKGHCMLNLSEGSEFLEFWGRESGDGQHTVSRHRDYQLLSKTEMRLASGAIATSRDDVSPGTKNRRIRRLKEKMPPREELPTPENSDRAFGDDVLQHTKIRQGHRQSQVPSRALAIRDQMGLTGLLDSQRRALAISQCKSDLGALRFRNKAQWTLEKVGNKVKQKHFVPDVPGRKNG